MKKLPYLPDLPSASEMYNTMVKDFMIRDVKFIWSSISYQSLKEILKNNKQLRSFPIVDSPDNMILLGSVKKCELTKMIRKQIGRDRRLEVAAKWQKAKEGRFEQQHTANIIKLREMANNEMLPLQAKKATESLLRKNLFRSETGLFRPQVSKKAHLVCKMIYC